MPNATYSSRGCCFMASRLRSWSSSPLLASISPSLYRQNYESCSQQRPSSPLSWQVYCKIAYKGNNRLLLSIFSLSSTQLFASIYLWWSPATFDNWTPPTAVSYKIKKGPQMLFETNVCLVKHKCYFINPLLAQLLDCAQQMTNKTCQIYKLY